MVQKDLPRRSCRQSRVRCYLAWICVSGWRARRESAGRRGVVALPIVHTRLCATQRAFATCARRGIEALARIRSTSPIAESDHGRLSFTRPRRLRRGVGKLSHEAWRIRRDTVVMFAWTASFFLHDRVHGRSSSPGISCHRSVRYRHVSTPTVRIRLNDGQRFAGLAGRTGRRCALNVDIGGGRGALMR